MSSPWTCLGNDLRQFEIMTISFRTCFFPNKGYFFARAQVPVPAPLLGLSARQLASLPPKEKQDKHSTIAVQTFFAWQIRFQIRPYFWNDRTFTVRRSRGAPMSPGGIPLRHSHISLTFCVGKNKQVWPVLSNNLRGGSIHLALSKLGDPSYDSA